MVYYQDRNLHYKDKLQTHTWSDDIYIEKGQWNICCCWVAYRIVSLSANSQVIVRSKNALRIHYIYWLQYRQNMAWIRRTSLGSKRVYLLEAVLWVYSYPVWLLEIFGRYQFEKHLQLKVFCYKLKLELQLALESGQYSRAWLTCSEIKISYERHLLVRDGQFVLKDVCRR